MGILTADELAAMGSGEGAQGGGDGGSGGDEVLAELERCQAELKVCIFHFYSPLAFFPTSRVSNSLFSK